MNRQSARKSEAAPPRAAELQSRSTCSVEEAAAVLGIGRSTAYAAAHDGSLPTLRVSHRLLVPTSRLLEMLGIERDREVEGQCGADSAGADHGQ